MTGEIKVTPFYTENNLPDEEIQEIVDRVVRYGGRGMQGRWLYNKDFFTYFGVSPNDNTVFYNNADYYGSSAEHLALTEIRKKYPHPYYDGPEQQNSSPATLAPVEDENVSEDVTEASKGISEEDFHLLVNSLYELEDDGIKEMIISALIMRLQFMKEQCIDK